MRSSRSAHSSRQRRSRAAGVTQFVVHRPSVHLQEPALQAGRSGSRSRGCRIRSSSSRCPPPWRSNRSRTWSRWHARNPGKLNWSGTTGAIDFLFGGFLKNAGLNMSKVPYRNPVEAANDLAAGRIQVNETALAIARPQLEAGKIKLLAVTNSMRAPTCPDLPTVKEAGYPDLHLDGLVGFFGPARHAAGSCASASPRMSGKPLPTRCRGTADPHRADAQFRRTGRIPCRDRGAARQARRGCQGSRHRADAVKGRIKARRAA